MYTPPNSINEKEYLERLEQFFSIVHENGQINTFQVTEMFLLHNDKLMPRETGRSCNACRIRVFKRLKSHYERIKTHK